MYKLKHYFDTAATAFMIQNYKLLMGALVAPSPRK